MNNEVKEMVEDYILIHHDIKGQRWGVRRYQNYDGTLTNLGKARRTMDAVNDIVSTMDNKDRKLLNVDGEKYQTLDEGKYLIKRVIKRVGGVPVSFFDVWGDSNGAAIAIGTRSGDEYRNKGYAKAVAKQGQKWLDEHYDDFDQIVWWARKENAGSIKTAKDIGFTLDKSSVLPDNPWIKYQYVKQQLRDNFTLLNEERKDQVGNQILIENIVKMKGIIEGAVWLNSVHGTQPYEELIYMSVPICGVPQVALQNFSFYFFFR